MKLAFQKAKAYKKSIEDGKKTKLDQRPVEGSGTTSIGKDGEDPVSVKVAMEKAKEYKKRKEVGGGGGVKGASENETNSGILLQLR